MKKSKKIIWGNCLVKNEGRYLWFAIMSVIDYLDKIIIWDTGSIDTTLKIIKQLQKKFPRKIIFKEIGEIDAKGISAARQQMLEQTKSDWLLLLDGDEVWWQDSIKKVVDTINQEGDKLNALVSPTYNLIGDIYHYQEEQAGEYEILGRKGHFNLRAINRKVSGLHIEGEYPLEGFYDKQGILLQTIEEKLKIIDAPLLHFTHLERSTLKKGDLKTIKRKKKFKYEIGKKFPKNFKYPQSLYLTPPEFVPSPWRKMSKLYKIKALIQTPLKKIKRRFRWTTV